MCKEFQVAAGSIVGTDHLQQFMWKNNQDALAINRSDDCVIAVVADGCGTGAYSELGARLGAHMTAHRLMQLFGPGIPAEMTVQESLERVQASLVISLKEISFQIARTPQAHPVIDNFLFTLLALAITPSRTYIIGIGDGVYAVNGEVTQIGPFPKNEPPYIAYAGLVKSSIEPEQCRFVIHKEMPTPELQTACIGTDGAADFIRVADKTLPGKKKLVGPLSQFWTEDQFFSNPEMIRRRLNLINNPSSRPNWEEKTIEVEHGRLKDDTTLVVVRRCPQP